MKMLLMNTDLGLMPYGDDAYEQKKRLRHGVVYTCEVKELRNAAFHRKYMKLMHLAWEYLGEDMVRFFGGNERCFRHAVEVAAGSFELCYDIVNKRWYQSHKSVSFSNMKQDEFDALYDRVKDVLFSTFLTHIDINQFNNLLQF